MSKTLRKIALIPLKNCSDLTFHPSFQALLSFSSLSCALVSAKPLSVSFFQFLVILLCAVQIHFPFKSSPESDDLRIAVGSGCGVSLSHLMIWNSISPCPEYHRAPEALQYRASDTPSEVWLWIHMYHQTLLCITFFCPTLFYSLCGWLLLSLPPKSLC